MNSIFTYFTEIFHAVKSLLTGMKVTGRYFFSPWEIVTQQYPENRKTLKMYDRFKGEVVMPHNGNNEHRCTGCGICETACPNGSIEVIQNKIEMPDGKKKRIIDKHIYHLSMCTFCGLCIKSCPSDALAWGQEFEHAVFDRAKLTKILNKPGSSILKDIAE
ncbi:MAG: 4Fe-4S binding protein [Bacteroidetes bacterium]|nr:4Fe-4S binding protein [Bacteroidota bacterium]